jgi:hypothetical protein
MGELSGNKDTDLKFLSLLDDDSLFNLRSVHNRYINNLLKIESFWMEKSKKTFPAYLDDKKENETWKQFYLWQTKAKETFLGDLQMSSWYKSPFICKYYGVSNVFINLPSGTLPSRYSVFYLHDQFDNWIVYENNSTEITYIYISSLQKDSNERIRIDMNEIVQRSLYGRESTIHSIELYNRSTPELYCRFESLIEGSSAEDHDKINEAVDNYINSTLTQFFNNKHRRCYLDNNGNFIKEDHETIQEATEDFLNTVKPKIEPFLYEMQMKIQAKKEDDARRVREAKEKQRQIDERRKKRKEKKQEKRKNEKLTDEEKQKQIEEKRIERAQRRQSRELIEDY